MNSNNTSVAKTSPASEAPAATQQALLPAVDISESDSGITVLADMPGVSKDRLNLKVEGDHLLIEGRAQIDVPDNIELLFSEVRSPYFRRSFTLSRDLDPAKVEATLRNGVLKVHIPKAASAQPRRIEVSVA